MVNGLQASNDGAQSSATQNMHNIFLEKTPETSVQCKLLYVQLYEY